MKIEIISNGERKELELKGIKGREIDSLMKEMIKMQSVGEENIATALESYQAKQKDLAVQVSGLSLDELDDLDSDDRAKIFDYLTEKVNKSMGFSKLLSQ